MTDDDQRRKLRGRVLEIRYDGAASQRAHDRAGAQVKSDTIALYVSQGAERRLCRASAIPLADRSFDFVVCKNVLQKVRDPMAACRELMRVAPRGYIECPRSWAQYIIGYQHDRWLVDLECNTLIFRERFVEEDRDILNMRTRMSDPRFVRYWNSPAMRAVRNVEFRWNDSFAVRTLTRDERLNGCNAGQKRLWLSTLRRARSIDAVRGELRADVARLWRA